MHCPGGKLEISMQAQTTETAIATCEQNGRFRILGKSVPLSDIECTNYPKATAQNGARTICAGNLDQFEIGFRIRTDFIFLFGICFDTRIWNPVYSYHTVLPEVGGAQTGGSRPTFSDDLYQLSVKVDTLYDNQKQTVNSALGLPACSNKYIDKTKRHYFAKGHLTPYADFVYASQQRATMFYVNSVPQWACLNNCNWKAMEKNVKDYATAHGLLTVFTGSYGQDVLPHDVTKNNIPLYLMYDQQRRGSALPVPELIWKAVYHPGSQKGVVLISANNPNNPATMNKICPDVCGQITWLTWKPTDVSRGFSYCCSIQSFNNVYNVLPNLNVVGLLN